TLSVTNNGIRACAGGLRWLLREGETGNRLRIGLSNVDWFFMQCRAIIYCNTLLYFALTHQQETIKEP
ncbi:MAG: hypothetical protein LBQ66_11800, partial [Planctomycetaceae bacterium]|nr:hypothetical protein [Planctomycetaceae bacterium]